MLKMLKIFFSGEIPPISFPTSVFISKEEAGLEDFVQQIADTAKFRRWFNFFPFVWLTFDNPRFDVGSSGMFYFSFPPFRYKMTCVEVDPGKYYRAEFSGLMTGHVTTRFIPQKDGILMDHPLTVTAVNRWVYLYYWLFLRPPHLPFMAWRYSMLRKNLIKEREIKKLKSKD